VIEVRDVVNQAGVQKGPDPFVAEPRMSIAMAKCTMDSSTRPGQETFGQ